MNEQQIEQEIQEKGLTAPRITPDHIASKIKHVYYHSPLAAIDPKQAMDESTYQNLRCLTFCTIVLENGFTVTGESACVSPENFDPFIGQEVAYKNAYEKIWQLEGYLLKDKLHQKALLAKNLTNNNRIHLLVSYPHNSEVFSFDAEASNLDVLEKAIGARIRERIEAHDELMSDSDSDE